MKLTRRRLLVAGGATVVVGIGAALLVLPGAIDDARTESCDEKPGAPAPVAVGQTDSGFPIIEARRADDLVDSIGFNVHLYYSDTPYGRFDDLVVPTLEELGVRHVRDQAIVPEPEGFVDRIQRLHDEAGVGMLLSMDPRRVTPAEATGFAERLVTALDGVEGPNEYDLATDDWLDELPGYTRDLAAALDANPVTADLPLIAPSLVHDSSPARLAEVGIADVVDIGNFHPYAFRECPSSVLLERIGQHVVVAPDAPLWATESGWTTSTSRRGVTEAVQAKYLPRLFLEYFRYGVARTYSYELLDEFPDDADDEARFGIVRVDGTPKPAFDSVRNLIDVLEEPGADFDPAPLAYRLGGEGLDEVSQLLLARRDGSYQLVLWVEVDSVDDDVTVPVTLELDTAAEVTTTRTNETVEPTSAGPAGTRFEIEVPDHPVVVTISAA